MLISKGSGFLNGKLACRKFHASCTVFGEVFLDLLVEFRERLNECESGYYVFGVNISNFGLSDRISSFSSNSVSLGDMGGENAC